MKDTETDSTLRYLNGNCSWILTLRLGMLSFSEEVSVGPEVLLPASQDTFEYKCVVNEIVQLRAIITVHGKKLTSYNTVKVGQWVIWVKLLVNVCGQLLEGP